MEMEVDDQDTVKKKRPGRAKCIRKLLVGDRVEVRSVEDGFHGSWHAGTVIACPKRCRHVKYDHILCDDGSKHLVDAVNVSPALDGIGSSKGNQCNYRGYIRPLPPPVEFGSLNLPYGLCVDVYYNEAWWEGVIFDYENGSGERKIFFPDLGDEMKVGLDVLRITQNWDEVSENWQCRGSWLFLQVIHDLEQVCPFFVSIKQIWYDVREKKSFEKVGEWTSNVKALWKELVLEVFGDHLNFFAEEFCKRGPWLAEPSTDFNLNPEADLSNHAVVPAGNPFNHEMIIDHNTNAMKLVDCGFSAVNKTDKNCGLVSELLHTDPKSTCTQLSQEKFDLVGFSSATMNDSYVNCNDKAVCVLPLPLLALPCSPDEISGTSLITNGEGLFSSSSHKIEGKPIPPKGRKTANWLPVGHNILPGAEFFPDAFAEYARADYSRASTGKNKVPNSIIVKTRMHLTYLGWKIEYSICKSAVRLRYVSPGGKCYYSLRQVFQALREPTMEILPLISPDEQRSSHTSSDVLSSLPSKQLEESEDPDYCPRAAVSPHSDVRDVGPMLHYSLPVQTCFCSLKQACKGCIEQGLSSDSIACTPRPTKPIDSCDKVEDQLGCEKLSAKKDLMVLSNVYSENWSTEASSISLSIKLSELGKVRGIRKLHRKRNQTKIHAIKGRTEIGIKGKGKFMLPKFQKASCPKLKRGKESGALIKSRDNAADNNMNRVLRSSKRARSEVIPSPSHHNPRTILSWLIDNNAVLPRAKVYYWDRKDRHAKAEGRITRDGIKCCCCQKVFTLGGFEVHAGSKYHRPAANTFLKDGRSLLDCQTEIIRDNIIRDNKLRRCIRKPCDGMKRHSHQRENDNICSVCHYGGELVLCDQCPSSFHKSCLGLEGVPEGDWFCLSCCCGICGQRKFKGGSEHFVDGCFLNCDQCENKYHFGCLRKTAVVNLESYPKENWFCSKKCEKISLCLHMLLGKPIPVGVDNLTWTLLKCANYDDQDFDTIDTEVLTENYSKLYVALGVMHDCFEPLKDTLTGRDLVEDVIFSKGSDLKRLNFRGFYTVLLERNDEIITVATVRVYGEVAEVPLVGTSSEYRRLGMCRTLMNELEKKLMELGVERLILPAIPSVLNTWTTSFGFSVMTDAERFRFLHYTFLYFQDTIMCQKFLKKIDLIESNPSGGTQLKLCDGADESCDNIDFDGYNAISKVMQAEQREENAIMDQRLADIVGGGVSNEPVHLAGMVLALRAAANKPWRGKISPACLPGKTNSKKEGGNKTNGYLKCYKRRRISAFGN